MLKRWPRRMPGESFTKHQPLVGSREAQQAEKSIPGHSMTWHNIELLLINPALREERRREDERRLRAFWALWLDSLWKNTLSCEGQTGALKGKMNRNLADVTKGYNYFFPSFLTGRCFVFFEIVFWSTPPGSCSTKAWWSAWAVWNKDSNNCQHGLELN